jgi:hypothetical protein
MSTVPVTISVDSAAAQAFVGARPEDRRKIELLLGLRLRELTHDVGKPLRQIMDEIGESAERNGLTDEKLAELLHGE